MSKIYYEKKLELVEPSNDICSGYLTKSESYLSSARLLVKNKKFEESISMAYYSMYYSLLALLFKVGIKSENHTASIVIMKELFNLDNAKIIFAKSERVDKQYYLDFKITSYDAEDMVVIAEKFNADLYVRIIKINISDILLLREKFKVLFSEIT